MQVPFFKSYDSPSHALKVNNGRFICETHAFKVIYNKHSKLHPFATKHILGHCVFFVASPHCKLCGFIPHLKNSQRGSAHIDLKHVSIHPFTMDPYGQEL